MIGDPDDHRPASSWRLVVDPDDAAGRVDGLALIEEEIAVGDRIPLHTQLDPTFFRVSVQGQPNDFDFTGPGEYEVEVPAACGSNPNFIHLDAFNTDVEPEANSQAEDRYEVDPGC